MEQVLYQLPNGWKWTNFQDVCTPSRKTVEPNSEEKYNYIALENIESNTGRVISNVPTQGSEISSTKVAFKKGMVLYGKLRPYLNKVIVAKTDGIATTEVIPFECSDAVNPDFLAYFLRSQYFVNLAMNNCSGARMPRATTKLFTQIAKVPLTSIAEQKRIVKKLDALLTRINMAIEYLQESVTLANELYASELNEIFPSNVDIESLLDKDGWISLSDICTFENGDRGKNYPSKSAFVAEGIPVVSAGNLGERYIDHKGLNFITPEHYNLLRCGRIKIGDILFCLRGSLGKVAISQDIDEGVIASSLVIIRPKECVSVEYLYKYLKSSLCQQFISYYNNGAAQPNLSAKSLGKFMLPLRSTGEQKIVVEGLDEKYQLNQKLINGLRSKIIGLHRLQASILDSAFKGEL